MKNVAFWDNQLCERGSTTAIYDYAYYNQKTLGNKSFIFYDENHKQNKESIIDKFKKEFIVHKTNNFKEVDTFLMKYNITHIFIIKFGTLDSRISKVAKNCIQCVFNCSHFHGDLYCSVSPWVKGNNGKYPVIPHMINLPYTNENLKNDLNIKAKVIFGGYGGENSFSIPFVKKVVYEIAKKNSDIYFLFANFKKFCPDLPNIIHLPMISNPIDKVKFINTCDAMLWARQEGETFGLAIGEFSSKNKPVIAMKIGDLAHYYLLQNKGIWYTNESDLHDILINFNPKIENKKDWNAFKDYTPDKVINIVNDLFLKDN